MVLKELEAILSSYHFRGSKRYPALLKYVVEAALNGRSGDLKERTLGVEVFGRDPDYDTSADPVVRFSASEVRKRIAQYYHENGTGTHLQIELPLGSYVPEFLFRGSEASSPLSTPSPSRPASNLGDHPVSRRHFRTVLLVVVAVLLAAGAVGFYAYRRVQSGSSGTSGQLWDPIVNSPRPILIVVGTSHPGNIAPEAAETTFLDHMTGPYHHVSVATATALANLAGVLRQHGNPYEIKEDTETSLTDIRSRPLILIGATNNTWTMHLTSGLRYRFLPGPMAQILDTKNPRNSQWTVDFSKPYSVVANDYAIVARFNDPTTEGPVLIIAGLGFYGTEAASAFVSSPKYLAQIDKQAPPGWQNKNIEMVIESDVIGGKVGPPVLVASTVW